MWSDRKRRKTIEERIAAERKGADDDLAKIDYKDDEEGQGPGSAQYDDRERYFLSETLYDRRELFWLDNSGLVKRARRLGIAIPHVIDAEDERVDEVAFAAFRREVNAAQLVEFKRWMDVIAPPLALIVALAAALATYSGNRRYNTLEALLTERTTRLEAQITASEDSATALRVRLQQLSDQLARFAGSSSSPTKKPVRKRRPTQASPSKMPVHSGADL